MRIATYLIAAAGLAGVLALPQSAAAQFFQYGNMNRGFGAQGPTTQYPALSPYLDIVRGGSPAINYFLGTIPELDRRNFQAGVLSTLPTLEGYALQAQQPADINAIPTLNQTGHLSAFQAYGSYYGYGVQQRPYYPYNPAAARTVPIR